MFANQIPNKSLTKTEYKCKYLTNWHDMSIDIVMKQIRRRNKKLIETLFEYDIYIVFLHTIISSFFIKVSKKSTLLSQVEKPTLNRGNSSS